MVATEQTASPKQRDMMQRQFRTEVNRILKGNATTPSKSINEVAKEVINGKWGNGSDRTNRLAAAGYDAKAVQNEVNRILR